MKTEIDQFNPCADALDFREKFSTFKEAWDACQRGDWMLWIASKLKTDKRALTLAKGKCAETVLHLMKDQRSRNAVKAAIDYGNGLINDEELRNAAHAAADAVDAAHAAADAAHAAHAAAYAANTAYAAAYAANTANAAYAANAANAANAAYAANAAANAAAYAANAANAANAAAYANRALTSNICREILTDAVMEKVNKLKP